MALKYSLEAYQDRLKSSPQTTKLNFEQAYKSFEEFCNNENKTVENKLKEISKNGQKFTCLQKWINTQNEKGLNPTTVRTRFNYLKRYLHFRGVKIYREDVTAELKLAKPTKDEKHPLTLDEARKIINEASYKNKALYLTLISSGMRIGETLQLKKKHFELNGKRYVILIPGNITKTKQGRSAIISSEATTYVKTILKELNDNDGVFSKNTNPLYATCNQEMIFGRILGKTGLKEPYENSRVNKITLHSFRAFFFTQALKVLGEDIAHAMIGHGAYLQQYQRRTLEDKLELYEKLEPELLVFDTSKAQAKIKDLEQANKKAQEFQAELTNLKKEFHEFKTSTVLRTLFNFVGSGMGLKEIKKELEFQFPKEQYEEAYRNVPHLLRQILKKSPSKTDKKMLTELEKLTKKG